MENKTMTKSTITRERAQQIFLGNGPEPSASEERELARMALAAMDSEPVAYIFKHPAGRLFWSLTDESNKGHDDVMPVYARPQPAPEEWTIADAVKFCKETGRQDAGSAMDAWNACRAATLQASNCRENSNSSTNNFREMLETSTNSPVIPDTWIPVSERMPDENADQQVLACFKGGDISALYYSDGRWDDAYGIVPIRQDVTHWMPLPAAPQEVKGE
ncbi:TPA: DUF551 domain-containing protein [Klebsiella pneumoniae]|uniref:DUF551 domain-containing protein n=1 Tax=Klebsiella pneumoniae TaxID=573 RepID=UPI000D6F1461|nr:DUF551 domain-containing protein [Klebsiella pneumoniae]